MVLSERLSYFHCIYKIFSQLHRKIIGIPIDSDCTSLVAVLCYGREFMLSLSESIQADVIESFISTSRLLDGLLSFENPCYEQIVMSDKSYKTSVR